MNFFTRLSGSLLLASSVIIPATKGWAAENEPIHPETSPSSLTKAFNLAADDREKYDGPLIAHMENSSYFFLNEDLSLHGHAATKILSDRLNEGLENPVPVYHLDINPIAYSMATREAFQNWSVITISTAKVWDFSRSGSGNAAPIRQISNEDLLKDRAPYKKAWRGYEPERFWDKSDAVIVASVGNFADDGRDKYLGFIPIYEADALILVGSIKQMEDGTSRIANYSSGTPDLVAFEAYDQGFSHPDKATISELRDFYNKVMSGPPPDRLVRIARENVPDDYSIGTSFSAPDVGGYIAKARLEHPNLHSNEVVTAALLATTIYTDGLKISPDYIWNGAGLPYDPGNGGHGAFLPEMFDEILDEFSEQKKASGLTTEFDRVEETGRPAGKRIAGYTFSEEEGDLTVMRTIGNLDFIKTSDDPVNSFPDKVEVKSPAGTVYEISLRLKSYSVKEVKAAFSSTAFLGEKAEGQWKIRVPEGYRLVRTELSHTGARNHGSNAVNWMIDYSADYMKAQRQPLLPDEDCSPWATRPDAEFDWQPHPF